MSVFFPYMVRIQFKNNGRKKEEMWCFFLTYTELAVHRWCHFQASLYRLHL